MTRLQEWAQRVSREQVHALARLKTGHDCGRYGKCDADCDEETGAAAAVLERETRALARDSYRQCCDGNDGSGVDAWLDEPLDASPTSPGGPR